MNEMTKSDQQKIIKQELNIRQWCEIIKDRQNSKQSIKAYCREHELREGAYYYWQRMIREKACACISDDRDTPAFVPISCETLKSMNTVTEQDELPPMVTLQIRDVRIEIHRAEGVANLSDIIKAVRASC